MYRVSQNFSLILIDCCTTTIGRFSVGYGSFDSQWLLVFCPQISCNRNVSLCRYSASKFPPEFLENFLEFFEKTISWNFVLKIPLPHLNRPPWATFVKPLWRFPGSSARYGQLSKFYGVRIFWIGHITTGTLEIAKVPEQKLLRGVDLGGAAASSTNNSTKKCFATVSLFR